MSVTIASLIAKVTADTSQAENNLKRFGDRVNDTSNKLHDASNSARNAGRGFRSFGQELAGVNQLVTGFKTLLGSMVIREIGGTLISMTKLAAQNAALAGSFKALAGATSEAMLQTLRRASKETIADADLMQSANRAMMLGVTQDVQVMSQLMQIAQARARAMGLSTTQAFNDIVTGIGRGSPLILDNLGITIDAMAANERYAKQMGTTAQKLTEAQKTQALLNEVLRQGTGQLGKATEEAAKAQTAIESLEAAWKNWKAAVAEALLPLAELLAPLGDYVNKLAKTQKETNETARAYGRLEAAAKQLMRQHLVSAEAAAILRTEMEKIQMLAMKGQGYVPPDIIRGSMKRMYEAAPTLRARVEQWPMHGTQVLAWRAKPAQTAAVVSETTAAVASKTSESMHELIDALVRLHPATRLAATAMAMFEAQIAAANAAIRANELAIRAAEARLESMREALTKLNEELGQARTRLDELSRVPLTGMGRQTMQIQAIEAQLKRMELARKLGISLADVAKMYPLLTEGAETYLAKLPTSRRALERLLEQERLKYELAYAEKQRLLQEAAYPRPAEMDYEQALASIGQTQARIKELTGQISLQEAAIKAQQAAVDALRAAGEQLSDALRTLQEQMDKARDKQSLMNQALELAYGWFLKDRQQMIEMGSEGIRQAARVDEQARRLLGAVSDLAQGTADTSAETLASMVSSFKAKAAEAVLAVSKELGKIPKDLYTTLHVQMRYEGGALPGIPGRQHGGPVQAGKAYIVGEGGRPELFVPKVAGTILPLGNHASAAVGLAGNQIIVNVHGSVITERDLTESIRRELLRLQRRNGTTGIAS